MKILMTMSAVNLILLLLPAIVYSKININIRPGKTIRESRVDVSGENVALLSGTERKTFRLLDNILNDAVQKYVGRKCDHLFLKNPTRFGNTYDDFGWEEIRRSLKPVEARITSFESKPVAVSSAEYVNKHDTIPSLYKSSTSHQVENTISHTWSQEGEVTVNQEIDYNFLGMGGTTSFSYTGRLGEENTKSRAVTIGTESTIETTVPPGGKVLAKIIASQNTMEIEIKYKVTFSGCLFCNYAELFKKHHFYCYDLIDLQDAANLPKEYNYTEKLNIGYYSDAKLETDRLNY